MLIYGGEVDSVRPADGAGDPLHALGPRPAGRPRLPLAGGLSRYGPDGLAQPHVDAGGARPRRRPAPVPRASADAPPRGLPTGLRRVPRARCSPSATSATAARRLGVPPGAERQGVGRRAAGRPHGDVARVRASSARGRCASSTTRGSSRTRSSGATDAALTFLWRVRNELHFLAGTSRTSSSADSRRRIAKNLGYEDDELRLGVETFMRDYYLHARAIHRISARLIARCQETLSRRGTVGPPEPAGGARRRARRLRRPASPRASRARLQEDPARHHAGLLARRSSSAASSTSSWSARSRRRRPTLVDRRVPALAGAAAICSSTSAARGDGWRTTLRRMHDTGVLGAYLPEFGALDLPRPVRHLSPFSVDQHSLLAVEVLEGLGPGRGAGDRGARADPRRGGAARAPHAGHAAPRHRQGPRPRPRAQGRAPHQGRHAPAQPGRR